jgi:hypothetical protein
MAGKGMETKAPRSRLFVRLGMAVALVLGLVAAGGGASGATPKTRLYTNERLTATHAIASANGEFSLVMRSNGDLVLVGLGQVFWRTHTDGNPGAYLLVRGDGDLVVLSSTGQILWQNGESFAGGSLVSVGRATVLQQDAARSVHWESSPGQIYSTVPGGQRLLQRQGLSNVSRQHLSVDLYVSTDGRMVINVVGRKVWISKNTPTPGGYVDMQRDGNLVIYSASGKAVWSAHTNGHPGAHLSLEPNSNLVVWSARHVELWSREAGLVHH